MGTSKYDELYARVMSHLNAQDWETAYSLVKNGDVQGDPTATAILSEFYRYGVGIPKDIETAIELLEKACDAGCMEAADALGSLYLVGEEVPQNDVKGVHYLSKAADLGDTLSMGKLANAYLYGHGLQKDYEKALQWAQKAAKGGDKVGKEVLAIIYDDGLGVYRDPAQAAYYYRECLQQDPENTFAMYRLCICLTDPFEDFNLYASEDMLEEAYGWASKGVELGDLDCHVMIAWFYEMGKVVRQDYDTAYKFYKIAADNGHNFAEELLKRFRKNIFGNYYIPES